jgi:fibronectin-binding autotransporter adhesin
VTRLVVTDSGGFTNQSLLFIGTADFSLSGGLDISGAENVTVGKGINTATADLLITANWTVFTQEALSTTDGDIVIKANEQNTSTLQSIGIDVFGGSVTTTGTGTVTMIGRGGQGTTNINVGVRVDNASTVSGAAVNMTGFGGFSTGNAGYGVYVSGSTVTSTGGAVVVEGTGGGTGSSSQNYGVYLANGGTISSGGAGSVTVTGTGGNTTGTGNNGVQMSSGSTSFIQSAGGAVSVSGTGGGSGTGTGMGMSLNSGSISAAGTGSVTVTGQGYRTTAISLLSASTIGSSGGAVDITAVNSGPTPGILMDATSSFTSAGGASLQITTDSINFLGSINSGVGSTSIRTYSAGTLIKLGSNDNDVLSGSLTLVLSAAELNNVTAGTWVIGSSTAGNITVASAVAPANVSQLELVTGGQILDTNASGTDITVARLGLTASTGIGLGDALDIAVGNLEASTATGGILVNNTGALTIGGVNSTLAGLRVTGASGNIDLKNTAGNVRITTAGDIILAPGDVSIQTLTSGNIITANNDGFNFSSYTGAVNSSGATLTLNAAGDIDLGETGNGNVRGDLKSLGNMALTAGGSIIVDDQASVQTVGGNGTTMTLTAGANVSVLHTHANGSLVGSQNTSVGLISIRTGAGGTFTLDANSSNPGVYAGAGGVLIAADDMVLLDNVLVVNGGSATLTTVSASRAIDLGTNTNGTLGLTSTEINQVTASSLTIGDSTSGSITFSASITPNPSSLSLVTGGSVLSTTSSGLDITVANLGITAATGIGTVGTPLEFSVDTLTTNTQGSNGSQFLSEANSVMISAADLRSGTGTITLTNGTYLTALGGDIVGDVVVGSGATLGGAGTVTGNVSGAGNVSPGSSPGTLTINGNFTPTGTVTLEVDPPAVSAGVDYDQLIVSGTVDLSGATLVLSGSTGTVSANRVLTLIQNGSASAITPSSTFANGAVVSINGNSYRLFYTGGTGDNDLILVENTAPAIVYVDDSFTAGLGNTIADADAGTTGSQAAIMGFDAFTSITAALAAITTSGTVIVNAGTYAETVSLSGTQTLKIGGTDSAQAVAISSLATVSGSTLNLAGTSSLTFGDSTNVTMAGLITGSGSLVKQGSGVVTVSGDNNYSGATTVSVGTLRVTANNGLGTTAAGTTVAAGAALDLRSVTYSTAEAVSLQGGTLSNSNGTTSFSGIATMTASSTFSTSSGSTLVLAGAVQGAFSLSKSGAGTVRLSNTGNSFSSITIGGGTLQLGAAGVIPDTADVLNAANFDLNGFDETLDSAQGNGSIGNSQSTLATLTLGAGNNNADSRLNGPITGAINLVKTGTGRQMLGAGSSSYTGTTTVNAGILAVTTENGGTATQALGAASGGTIVNAAGILEFQGVAYALAEPITVNGGIIRATAGGNNPTFGSTSFGGTITLSTGTATFNTTTAATLTLNGIIDGDQALTKTGVGTLILANDKT